MAVDVLERTVRDSLMFSPRDGFEQELLHVLRSLSRTGDRDLALEDAGSGLRSWLIVGSIAGALGVGVAVFQWTRHHAGRRAA